MSPILDPVFSNGWREYTTPLDVAVLKDLGIFMPDSGGLNDSLFGFDAFDNTVNLLAGDDFFNGVGNDVVSDFSSVACSKIQFR